jgi:hypothetical protein
MPYGYYPLHDEFLKDGNIKEVEIKELVKKGYAQDNIVIYILYHFKSTQIIIIH